MGPPRHGHSLRRARCDSASLKDKSYKRFSAQYKLENIWRIRNNAELDQVINRADIVRFIKAQRVKWLGHIQRMDTSRIAKRIFEWKPIGRRSLGRPRLRWLDDVCDYLKMLKVRNWKELATDRKAWNDLSEKAKTHKGL
jgi:hypothetical protein